MPSSSTRLGSLLQGQDVEVIAQKLLGSQITTSYNGQISSGIIVETEAYKAPLDRGSHAFNNKRTKRTETLFDIPGTSYVYLCYGIHHLYNIVTGPKNTAHAVLLRAIEPVEGMGLMLRRRKMKKITKSLTNGPGKLSQALGITTTINGLSIFDKNTKIHIELPEKLMTPETIIASPRVGIAYAKECANWPWRFRIKDNLWTSLPHQCRYNEIS